MEKRVAAENAGWGDIASGEDRDRKYCFDVAVFEGVISTAIINK